MKNFLRIFALSWLLSSPAFAGSGTIAVLDGGGVSRTYDVITDGTGNFVGKFGMCDQAAAAQCATVTAGNAVKVDGSAVTQPVSAAALPLPTGAATAAGLTTINTTLGTPFQAGASIGNTTFAATQATAASLNATVVGTGAFATQLTGATNNINNIAGTITLPTLASTSTKQSDGSQKTQIVDGSGNVIASTSNNLNVQCANCSGSGVSAADAATFTAGTSLMAPAGGQFTSGGATACVTGHECTVGITAARAFLTDLSSQAGTAITSTPTAYGTAPTGNVIGVNTFVTNSNANIGNNADAVAASASSVSPVGSFNFVYNGTTWDRAPGSTTGAQVKIVSGGMASGAMVDLVAAQTPIAAAAATATKSLAIGGQFDTTQKTLTNGQQASLAMSARGAAFVAVGADGFAVTNAGTFAVQLAANQSVNLAQVAGATTAVGSGVQATALRTTLATDSPGLITLGPATVANSVPFTYSSQYPTNATTTTPTAVTNTATGTTAATVATLGATAGVTNYICGFTITADATALATGTATVAGTVSGSLSYLQTIVAAANGTSDLTKSFNPCIPASAANTAITVTSAAAGVGGNTIVNIQGYRL